MCGIAAHFSFGAAAAPLDLSLLLHRGPDAQGEWISPDERIWLGNTRLAILDLSPNGSQPMIDPATGNVIVVNGEIYNHRELRAEIGNRKWRGTSDTETILAGYASWGPEIVSRLKGMFALAIYDSARQELFVARDRLGIKPLYYTLDEAHFRLASEVKVLTTLESEPTPASISAYLQCGACPEERILYPAIRALPAGHCLTIGSEAKPRLSRYWPARQRFISSTQAAPEKLRALLETAVEEHLLSDVPVAGFLSGGIDSSIVTALAAQRLGSRLLTFTVGFDMAEFDESAIALQVAQRYGTTHRRLELNEDEVIQSVTEAVAHLDLPSVDAINTYIVSRAVAREGVKVALSGLGGDELFGGYPSFRDVPRLKWLAQLPRGVRRLLGGARLMDLPNHTDVGLLTRWRRRFFTDEMLQQAGLPNDNLTFECPVELPDDFARISWAELTGYMRHMLLRDSDQMSMAVSLELRVPFLDHQLVEYSLGLPAAEKQRYGRTKGLLVQASRDLLPAAVYERPKAGFALPMQKWMSGPLANFVDEGLCELVVRGFLPDEFVANARKGFRQGRLHWTRLWSMVVLGHFVRQKDASNRSNENPALHSLA
ncbi:MAG TPA: asparagine synthase (glutamine-hydrolyzing) [Chthoniobacterales bacterium]|jgi:asparagine synthase (glutamine-hydrolysing)|nr:asparagine synthase (glutamine-hydrolyzing) [Chthoniobacterales bacterium]